MNRYDHLYNKLAGITLIAGPLLLVIAAIVAAAGLGTTTGRWYENFPEGALMIVGFSLLIIGLQALSGRIGLSMPRLGIVIALMSVFGIAGAIMPSFTRVEGSIMVARGITAEQLDLVHNAETMTPAEFFILPFIICFFLSFLLIAYGLWRVKASPRWAPLVLAAGSILFPMAQAQAEPNMVLYIAATTAWLLGFAPVGMGMLREPSAARIGYAESPTT
jgi:hypothetical protein